MQKKVNTFRNLFPTLYYCMLSQIDRSKFEAMLNIELLNYIIINLISAGVWSEGNFPTAETMGVFIKGRTVL